LNKFERISKEAAADRTSRRTICTFGLRPRKKSARTFRRRRNKEKRKIFKELFKLKWHNRWTQQELCSYCPIAPLKNTIRKSLSPLLLYQK